MPDNLETAVLNALYMRFESHPGSPRMTLGQLCVAIGVPPNEGGEVREVHRQLLSLKRKGWVEYQILEDGSGGAVEITPEAIRVVLDRQQTPVKIPPPIQSEAVQGTLSHRDRTPSLWQLLLASVLSLVAGVFGNLIASWIQQEWVGNVFTLSRIAVILLLTGIVLVIEVSLQLRLPMSPKWRIAIFGAVLAITTLIVIALPRSKSPEVASSYTLQVQSQETGEDIRNAEVRLDLAGKAPLRAITDSDGFARIPVDISYNDHRATLVVEATGYKKFRQEIDLTVNDMPHLVQLEPTP